jgi:hypothetical protein
VRGATLPGNNAPTLVYVKNKMIEKRKNKQIVAFIDATPMTEPYSGTLIFIADAVKQQSTMA